MIERENTNIGRSDNSDGVLNVNGPSIPKEIENVHEYVENLHQDTSLDSIVYASKSGYVKAERVTNDQVKRGERLKVYTKDGTLEAEETLIEGRYVLTRVNPDGTPVLNESGQPNQWQVDEKTFLKKYDAENPTSSGAIRPKGGVQKFIQVNEDIEITAPWGEKQIIKAGGYLNITNPNDIYGIQKDEFNETYMQFKELQDFLIDAFNKGDIRLNAGIFEGVEFKNGKPTIQEVINVVMNNLSPENLKALQERAYILKDVMNESRINYQYFHNFKITLEKDGIRFKGIFGDILKKDLDHFERYNEEPINKDKNSGSFNLTDKLLYDKAGEQFDRSYLFKICYYLM